MISKTVIFCLVYVLNVLNFFVMLSPLTVGFIVKTAFGVDDKNYLLGITMLLISITSCLMLLLFLLDFIFASTVRKYHKICKPCKKYKELWFLEQIFEKVKNKFNCHNVELLIANDNNINAYAVGSFRKNVVVLTTGIIKDYEARCGGGDEFFNSMEGIIAHEMSHIINRDYFPSLLLVTNERVLNFISKLVFLVFNILIKVVNLLPFVGKYAAILIKNVHEIFDYIIRFFYNKIALKFYKFLQLQISKQVEYRADKQASQEVGGNNMAIALSFLGKSGFFNIFSTHPKTQNRVKKAREIAATNGNIRSVFLSNTCFFLSFIMLVCVTVKAYKMANMDKMLGDSKTVARIARDKYLFYKNKIFDFMAF